MTGRRLAVALIAALCAAACTSAPAPEPAAPEAPKPAPAEPDGGFRMCEVPRPQACTREFAPVCAHLADGSLDTRPNGCTACSDISVFGYRAGSCR